MEPVNLASVFLVALSGVGCVGRAAGQAGSVEESIFNAVRENDFRHLKDRVSTAEDLAVLHLKFPHRTITTPRVLETSELHPLPPEELSKVSKDWSRDSCDAAARAVGWLHRECRQRGLDWSKARLKGVRDYPWGRSAASEKRQEESEWDVERCLLIEDDSRYYLLRARMVNQPNVAVPSKYAAAVGKTEVPARIYVGATLQPLQLLAAVSFSKPVLTVSINLTHPFSDRGYEIWVTFEAEAPEAEKIGEFTEFADTLCTVEALTILMTAAREPVAKTLAEKRLDDPETRAALEKEFARARATLERQNEKLLAGREGKLKSPAWTVRVKPR